MKYFIYIIVYICLEIQQIQSFSDEWSLDNYLQQKMLELSLKQEARLKRNVDKFVIENTHLHENQNAYQFAYFFNIFNDSYMMLDKNIYTMSPENFKNSIKLIGIEDDRKISHVKVIEHGNIYIMFIVFNEKYVKIIKFIDSILKYQEIQTIKHVQISDVSFFVNQGNLYLIVSNAKDDNLVPVSIYEWKDDQFDEQITVHLDGITQLQTFKDGEVEIILMVKKTIDNLTFLNIFEFENKRLSMKQKIKIDKPIAILPYEVGNDQYVSILNRHGKSDVYRWTGFELIEWSSQTLKCETETAFLMNEKTDVPIIFTAGKGSFCAYKATSDHIEFVENFRQIPVHSRILYFNYLIRNQSNFIIYVGNNEGTGLIKTFKLQIWKQKQVSAKKDPLQACLDELHEKLTSPKISPLIQELTGRPMATYSMESRNNENEDPELEDLFQKIHKKYSSLEPVIKDLKEPVEEMVINGQVTVEGTLTGKIMQAEHVIFKEINGKKWTPNQWLSYTQNQTISGGIDANVLKVINLETTPEVTIFDDLLLNNTNTNIRGDVKISNLKTVAMRVDKLNDINVDDIFIRDRDVIVTGNKTFSQITAGSVESVKILNKPTEDVLKLISTDHFPKMMKSPNVEIDDLVVEDIDGINWNNFKDSVFRYGDNPAINGNLKLKKFESNLLDLETLNGVNIENFLTTSTDQNISSSISFRFIYTSNVTANTVNNISLPESVAFLRNPIIKGPVSIEDIHITGDLILNNYFNSSEFLKKNQHIVGTNESDLLQIYTGKIRIKGNLRVKNLVALSSSSVLIGEEEDELKPYFRDTYWMKSYNQIIPVHAEMQRGLTTPHLQTKLLNGFEIRNLMLNNSSKILPTIFAFENVTFMGNILLDDEKIHTPNLMKINAESIKNNGTFVIHGKKIFQDSSKIQNLSAERLNDTKQDDLVTKTGPTNFIGKKIFERLVVNGDFVTSEFSCEAMNSFDLIQLQQETVYIDRPQTLESLKFNSVSIENLNVQTLNERIIEEIISETNTIIESDVIDSVIINGELSIGNLRNLSKINGKLPDILHRNKLKKDEQGGLHGNVRFLNNVTIDNLSATIINNINFKNLTKRLLYKQGDQVITSPFFFENVKIRYLDVSKINNFPLDLVVDVKSTKPQIIVVTNGIQFNSAIISKLIADKISPCKLDIGMMESMRNPPTQSWNNIKISGNVTILDTENSLYNIFKNVVLTSRKNQIEAPVHFGNISVENLVTKKNINDINLIEIFDDALQKKTEEEQIISGVNFLKGIALYSAAVHNNTDIPVVNNIELPKIKSQAISRDEVNHIVIRGRKTFFSGVQTEKIKSQKISDVSPDDLVTMDNNHIITTGNFENVQIRDELNLNRINGHDFNLFLEERLLLSSPQPQNVTALYSFYDVYISGNVKSNFINDIGMDDVVYDTNFQDITSRKTFLNDTFVIGNVDIEMLNGYIISEVYQKAFLKNEQSVITGNVEILKPSTVHGTIRTKYINGYSMETIKNKLDLGKIHHNIEEIRKMIKSIEQSAKRNYELVERMPSELLYIEKSQTLQLSFQNSKDARVLRVKDNVLIHVTGEEKGDVCALPKNCPCPVQHTIQISPHNSINSFANKGTQRVYSFDDKLMTVHLMTDSISTSVNCRVNSSTNETTTLAWSTITPSKINRTLFSYQIDFNGYVSAVEYFTSKGITYIIVGKYYDPRADSYDLDFIVLKFDRNRETVREIQRQPTNGICSLKIFYTAQGINLIVGILGNGHDQDEKSKKTLIMRFDEKQEQFFLLREVQAYSSSSSVGIVLGTESFIALSHKKYPVLIFKYDQFQDNYIYYQNLWDPVPIGGLSLFYTGGVGISDPYLCVVSEKGTYSIYTYEYIEGWKRKFYKEMNGIRNLVPFELNEELYLLALSTNMSSVLSVVKFG
ncbi:hypothetical protein WA026_008891 [Henosepilachna vigintioctopunctata]|uniref:Uncharacterized protein n=1 Tax=Henosepilachna vigintioctopunctata TaxID=420089 RepID=A0AAW1VAB8_9CUCU